MVRHHKMVLSITWPQYTPNDDGEAGFSLAEILVTLVVLALITAMTTGFLGQLGKVVQVHQDRAAQQQIDSITRYLERAFEAALALPIDISQNKNRAFFIGNSTDLTFVSGARIGISEAALRTRHIHLLTQGHANQLAKEISMRRFDKTKNGERAPIIVPIIEGVTDLRFFYLGKPGKVPDGSWASTWSENRSLPVAVRFSLEVERDGRIYKSDGFAKIQTSSR